MTRAAEEREDVLDRSEIPRILDSHAELLVDLAHDGFCAALSELDPATRRPPTGDALGRVWDLGNQDLVAAAKHCDRDRSVEVAAHSLGRLVWWSVAR